jgi:hypothetical protein
VVERGLVMDDRQQQRQAIEAYASVSRVKAWKKYHGGRKPSFSDYRAYYHAMRWGPCSYWTWRSMMILIFGAVLVYIMFFTACFSGGHGCNPSMTWNPSTWFLRPLP